jgi:transcription factor TGA
MVHGEESSWRMERAALPLNPAFAYGFQLQPHAAAAPPPSCFLYVPPLLPQLGSGWFFL